MHIGMCENAQRPPNVWSRKRMIPNPKPAAPPAIAPAVLPRFHKQPPGWSADPAANVASTDRAAGKSPRWHGDDGLTMREREIALLVASGLSNREIADELVISKRTVDAHVNHIFTKLGVSSRVQLTIWLRDRVPERLPDELSAAVHA